MKALLITAIASFFALTVSAQVATDTKTTNTTQTGTKQMTVRPAKVAVSTSPIQSVDVVTQPGETSTPATGTTAPPTRKDPPVGVTKEVKTVNPGSQKPLTGNRISPSTKEATPHQ